jgi:hypothetical protein
VDLYTSTPTLSTGTILRVTSKLRSTTVTPGFSDSAWTVDMVEQPCSRKRRSEGELTEHSAIIARVSMCVSPSGKERESGTV